MVLRTSTPTPIAGVVGLLAAALVVGSGWGRSRGGPVVEPRPAEPAARRLADLDSTASYFASRGGGLVNIVREPGATDFEARTRDGRSYDVVLGVEALRRESPAIADFFVRHEFGHAYLGHPLWTRGHPWIDEHLADAFALRLLWLHQGVGPALEVIDWFEQRDAPATASHPSYRARAGYLRDVFAALTADGGRVPEPRLHAPESATLEPPPTGAAGLGVARASVPAGEPGADRPALD